MKEIWVPQTFIVIFLALPLFRPYSKSLRPVDGLGWLPAIALLITIGIFPAYGFRPECLPVLFAGLLICAANLLFRLTGSSLNQSPFVTAVLLIFLTAAVIPMFAFSSRTHTETEENARPVRVESIEDSGRNFDLRIYEANQPAVFSPAAPVIFIIPPELGSADSLELVCKELQKFFTVVTYTHKDYDAPLRYWRIFKKAADLYSANERGKALEAERRTDIALLLPRLPSVLGITGRGELPPLLLAGYGAGGSALAYMAGENTLTYRYGKTLGVIAIESRLWSSYRKKDPHVSEIPEAAGKIRYQWALFADRFRNMGAQRVIRMGPLPGTGLPVMYLLSGRALDVPKGQKPYEAVIDAMRSGPGPAALAAIESAGLLDYQDFPLTHPVYSFLLPGQKGTKKSSNPIGDTAGIIGNFAAYLLEREIPAAGEEPEAPAPLPYPAFPRLPIDGNVYFESKGLGGFRL